MNHTTAAQRHNARMDKIWTRYREQKKAKAAEHNEMNIRIVSVSKPFGSPPLVNVTWCEMIDDKRDGFRTERFYQNEIKESVRANMGCNLDNITFEDEDEDD